MFNRISNKIVTKLKPKEGDETTSSENVIYRNEIRGVNSKYGNHFLSCISTKEHWDNFTNYMECKIDEYHVTEL